MKMHWESDLGSDPGSSTNLAGCSFTEHTLTSGSPRARHYSRGWAYSRVILDWSLDPSECHFFIHTAAGLDDYKVTEIPSSCQI